MKKTLLLLALCGLIATTQAQLPTNAQTGQVQFTEVVTLDGKTKDDIYKKAKLWVVSTLKSGDNMVELSGTNSDQIVGTGNLALSDFEIPGGFDAQRIRLNFKCIIFCKDGKYKFSFENFTLHYAVTNGSLVQMVEAIDTDLENLTVPKNLQKPKRAEKKKAFLKIVEEAVKAEMEKLSKSLKASMAQSQDDW